MPRKGETQKRKRKMQLEVIEEHTADKLAKTANAFLMANECEIPQCSVVTMQESVDKVTYVCVIPYYVLAP